MDRFFPLKGRFEVDLVDCGCMNQEIGGKLTRWVGLYDGVVWWSVKNVEVFVLSGSSRCCYDEFAG